jgi:hypothetical protein
MKQGDILNRGKRIDIEKIVEIKEDTIDEQTTTQTY